MLHRSHVPHTDPFARIRFQLPLGLLAAGGLPYLLRLGVVAGDGTLPSVNFTLVLTIIAICIGYYFVRSLSIFPSINAAFYVAPCFLASYGGVAFATLLSRADYSRSVFFSSLVICIVLYTLLFSMLQRRARIRIGIVPVGQTDRLLTIPNVSWQWLRSPEDPVRGLDGVVADFRADLPDAWERKLADCALEGLIVYHVKQLQETLTGRVDIEHLSENSFGSLVPLASYLRFKLLLDFVTSIVVLPAALILLGVVAVIVKLDSPGPFIFRQQRMGYRGRPFTVYKVRTMRHEPADAGDARKRAMTLANDDRITRVGRFLRRSRIDEIPQIFNVLKGEMSWIGPRPEAQSLSEWYERELPFYRYRHVVRPGITGWAQVNQGHVAEVEEVREKLQNDFYYIKFFSPWLDLVIVVKTLNAVLTGFGSR